MAYESEIEKLRRRYDEKPEQWFAALADAHRKAGDLEQAVRIVEEGIKQRPNYVSGHIVLGRCLVDQGADDRAEKVFEEVLELDAENIIALKVLGDVSERRGNPEAARRWLGRLLEVDPMNDEAREMLEKVSQPQSPPPITPKNPDVPIVTQSAARAAGVVSSRDAAPEVDAIEGPGDDVRPPAQRDSGNSRSVDSRTSVRELLDAAASSRADPNAAANDDEPGFVIERAQEALPSGEHAAMDVPPFEAFSEAETKMVSFDEPAPSFQPSDEDDDGSSDLAAGTLDFVAPEPAEPEEERDRSDPVSGEAAESVPPPVESVADESPFEEEQPLELEAQPEPEIEDPLQPHGEVSTDDLPEDVASIFASAPPISQLSPSDETDTDNEDSLPETSETVDELTTSELSVPTPEVEDDFLADDIGPEPKATESFKPTPSNDLASLLDAAFDPVPADVGSEEDVADVPAPAAEALQESPAEEEPEPAGAGHTPLDDSIADVMVDEAIVGSITAPEPEPEVEASSPLVTETMAEVYASQGHFDQARDVYRQLLADSPGDEGLQKRLAALEERAHNAASRSEGRGPKKFAASETGGVSVRSMMSSILTGSAAVVDVAAEEEVVFVTPSEPSPMEEAFGESPVARGEPTRPATDGPSLASLFGDEPDRDEGAKTEGQDQEDGSPDLTYDGFYGSPERTPSTTDTDDREGDGDDDEEFKAWLQSLKS